MSACLPGNPGPTKMTFKIIFDEFKVKKAKNGQKNGGYNRFLLMKINKKSIEMKESLTARCSRFSRKSS